MAWVFIKFLIEIILRKRHFLRLLWIVHVDADKHAFKYYVYIYIEKSNLHITQSLPPPGFCSSKASSIVYNAQFISQLAEQNIN